MAPLHLSPPTFSVLENLQRNKGANQLCIADRTRGKYSMSANWARSESFCRQIGLEASLFVGKLGSKRVFLSANWARSESFCRQIGLEASLFVGKLGCAPHQQFLVASPLIGCNNTHGFSYHESCLSISKNEVKSFPTPNGA